MKSSTHIYQEEVAELLRLIYPRPTTVEVEWSSIRNIRGLYSPRVDIAVGPFSNVRGDNRIAEYDELLEQSRPFITRLINYHRENIDLYSVVDDERLRKVQVIPSFEELSTFNQNARCLLAIEVENKVSRKHLLGGAVNASALGRVGIVIGWTEDKVRALVKLRQYWHFLGMVGKNTFQTPNLLILSPAQFMQTLIAAVGHPSEVELKP